MSNDIISEKGNLRHFMNIAKGTVEFGKKPPEDEDTAAQRRTGEVVGRANAEKKTFGFLRSVANKTFGKKAPEPAPEPRAERSEEERRAAVIDRARK